MQYCLQCGAVAIGHLGVASEYHKVAGDDRARLIEIVVDEVAGRVPVFIFMFYEENSGELLKAILYRRGIIDFPKVIPPMGSPKMSAVKRRELEWLLERAGLTSRWPDIR